MKKRKQRKLGPQPVNNRKMVQLDASAYAQLRKLQESYSPRPNLKPSLKTVLEMIIKEALEKRKRQL